MKRELNYDYMGGEGGEQIEKLHNNTFQGIYSKNFCHKVYFTQFGCLFIFLNKRIFPSLQWTKFTSICIYFYSIEYFALKSIFTFFSIHFTDNIVACTQLGPSLSQVNIICRLKIVKQKLNNVLSLLLIVFSCSIFVNRKL